MVQQQSERGAVIHENGCLRAGEEWAERNLMPIAAATVAMAVLQVQAAGSDIWRADGNALLQYVAARRPTGICFA